MTVRLTRATRLALIALLGVTLLATLGTAQAQAAPEYYKIVARHSGMCLDVAYGSMAHAADVIQGRCSGKTNQQWKLVSTDSGYYELRARHSNMCLDVAHASVAHAADVIQGRCWNGMNQQWTKVRMS